MIYYLGLILSVFVVRLLSLQFRKNDKAVFYTLTALIVILFQGLRSFSVGTDLLSYIPSYSRIGRNIPFSLTAKFMNYEIGYILLNKLIYILGFNERGFLIIVTIIIQAPIFYTMYKYSESPLLSVFSYFAFGNFIMTFSGLRQAISMSLCFVAYVFIKNKKPIWFILIVFLACCFHKSAMICFLLYPLYYIRVNKIAFPFILLGIVACFIFRNQIFALLSKIYYGAEKETQATGAYTMFIMYLLLYIIANVIKCDEDEYKGLTNIMLVLVCVYSLASIHSFITRMAYPISLYLTLLIPKIVSGIKLETEKDHFVVYGLCNLLCIACFMYFLGGLNTLPFSFM